VEGREEGKGRRGDENGCLLLNGDLVTPLVTTSGCELMPVDCSRRVVHINSKRSVVSL